MLLLLFFVALVLAFVYFNGKYSETYWKKRGVTYHKRSKLLGLFGEFILKDQSFFENLHDIYKAYPDEPAVGTGSFLAPLLYVRDPLNIQHIMATDFNSFNHRGIEPNEDDVLANSVTFLNGKKWKLMRQSMTPLFTSAKLKNMYYILDKSAQDFVQYLKENPKLLKKDTFSTLTTFCCAAIAASVFGVTTKSIFDSSFLKVAREASATKITRSLKFALFSISPRLYKLFNLRLFKEYEEFFIGAIKQVIRQRETEKIKKHDFADICVSLQSNGTLKDSQTEYEVDPTDEVLSAQAFFFFTAGVEPTANAMFGTLIELGKCLEIQQRIQKEIDNSVEQNDGKITYDFVANNEYLDMVVCEAMRIYPPIGFLTRKCIADTVLPQGNIKVDKGTNIITAVYELHHDPKYYPEPEKYIPERFSRENRNPILDMTYMPYGKGHRNCIGMRYAQLQAKSGIVHLLRNFSLKTIFYEDRPKYAKEQIQVRFRNVDVELIPRV